MDLPEYVVTIHQRRPKNGRLKQVSRYECSGVRRVSPWQPGLFDPVTGKQLQPIKLNLELDIEKG